MKTLLNKFSDWYFNEFVLPHWIVLSFDSTVVFLSNLLIYSLNSEEHGGAIVTGSLIVTLLLYLIAYLIGFIVMRTYTGMLRYSSFLDLLRIGCAMLISLVIIAVSRTFLGLDSLLQPVGLKILCQACMLSTLLMWTARILVKYLYDVFFNVAKQENVFIYGIKEGGVALAKSIRNEKPSRYSLAGFFTDDTKDAGKELMAKTVYFLNNKTVEIMRKKRAKILLVSPLKSAEFRRNTELQNELITAGIKIHMMPSVVEWNGKSPLTFSQLKEVDIEDLLPRDKIEVDLNAIGKLLADRIILITGSAGSIGSEMVRQIAKFKPRKLILIDQAETPQHDIRLMMSRLYPNIETKTIVTSICNAEHMERLFCEHRPEYVFHAAAYKHVPMMEDNPSIAVQNNIMGTQILAKLAVKYGVKKFVMISTDKAVNPTNVMGCSKRICEIDVQSMDFAIKRGELKMADGKPAVTQFVTTRFGNVLGSNGSVIPLFKQQIKNGGPITVTHPDIIRFFMLIPEACQLVLEAGTMGHGGEIFVFDMGEPVKIVDLAKRMIKLSGAKDMEIKFTGLRDGEKLYEEVLNEKENTAQTPHPKILVAKVRQYDYNEVVAQLDKLYQSSYSFDDMSVVKVMKEIVPEFKSQHSKYETLDKHQNA